MIATRQFIVGALMLLMAVPAAAQDSGVEAERDAGIWAEGPLLAQNKRRRRNRKKKPPPPPEQVKDDEIDQIIEEGEGPELTEEEKAKAKADAEPIHWSFALSPTVGLHYSNIDVQGKTVESSAFFLGVRGAFGVRDDNTRAYGVLSYFETENPDVSVDGKGLGSATHNLGIMHLGFGFEGIDVWKKLTVGGGAGGGIVFNPRVDLLSLLIRFSGHAGWELGKLDWAVFSVTVDLGLSATGEKSRQTVEAPSFRGPVIDLGFALEARFEEVGQW